MALWGESSVVSVSAAMQVHTVCTEVGEESRVSFLAQFPVISGTFQASVGQLGPRCWRKVHSSPAPSAGLLEFYWFLGRFIRIWLFIS